MSTRISLALLVAVLGVAAFAGVTLATPASGVTNTAIGSGTLPETKLNIKTGDWKMDFRTKGDSTVIVTESRVAPGGTSAGTAIRAPASASSSQAR